MFRIWKRKFKDWTTCLTKKERIITTAKINSRISLIQKATMNSGWNLLKKLKEILETNSRRFDKNYSQLSLKSISWKKKTNSSEMKLNNLKELSPTSKNKIKKEEMIPNSSKPLNRTNWSWQIRITDSKDY